MVEIVEKFWRVAEKNFSGACTEASITCNKCEEDEHGWDYILDIEPSTDKAQLLSAQQTLRQVLVQIKSTTKGKTSCPMKLSNALNLAKVLKPCYVVFYSRKGRETKVYLKHIWENEIYAIHKFATQCESIGKAEFHKVNYTLKFSEDELCSGSVAEAIKRHQVSLTEEYPSLKSKIANAVGYEDGSGIGKMTLELESRDDFIKMMLGLKSDVSCPDFSLTPKRFGIPIPHLTKKFEKGKISLEPEYSIRKVRVRIEGYKPQFYDARTTDFHFAETSAVRIDIAEMNFILSTAFEMQKENFSVDREERKLLNELIFICGCFSGKEIEVDILSGEEWKYLTKLTCKSELEKSSFSQLLECLVWLQKIENKFIGRAEIKFSLNELKESFKQMAEAYILGNYDGASLGFAGDLSKVPVEIKTLIRPVFILSDNQLITLVTKSNISKITKTKIVIDRFEVENINISKGEHKIEQALDWFDTESRKFNGTPGIMYVRHSGSV